MTGEKNINKLLKEMSPVLLDEHFVFLSLQNAVYGDYSELAPIASFSEDEGLTLVVERHRADQSGLSYDSTFRCITLKVHSSLDAVGLTAAFSGKLAEHGISANVIAGFFHDHIFINEQDSQVALLALKELSES